MRLSFSGSLPRFGMEKAPSSAKAPQNEVQTPPNNDDLPRDQYGRIMGADYYKPCLATKKSIEDFDKQCIEAAKGTGIGRGFISNRRGAIQPDGSIKR